MLKRSAKKHKHYMRRNALTATLMIFVLAVSSIITLAYHCQGWIQSLLCDDDGDHFFNFGS